jgi:hypothetical protein
LLGSKTTGDQRLVWIEDLLGSKTRWDQRLEIEDRVRWDRRLGDSLGSKTWDQRLLGSKTWGGRLGIEDLGSKACWDKRLGCWDQRHGIDDSFGSKTRLDRRLVGIEDNYKLLWFAQVVVLCERICLLLFLFRVVVVQARSCSL